jgi:hypothetical protein
MPFDEISSNVTAPAVATESSGAAVAIPTPAPRTVVDGTDFTQKGAFFEKVMADMGSALFDHDPGWTFTLQVGSRQGRQP